MTLRCSVVLRHSIVVRHFDFVISSDGFIRHLLPNHCGSLNHAWRTSAEDGASGVGVDVCSGDISIRVFGAQAR
jgi:hypothetical protein